MTRCILHIGWHKTGSTAVQHFLHAHASVLAEHGVVYPTHSANHSAFLPSAFMGDAPPSYSELFVLPMAGREHESKRAASSAITNEILDGFDAETLVLSAEDMSLLEPDAIRRCHARLTAAFDDVEVVAYLRDHSNYVRSATQQLLRMGFGVSEILAMAQGEPPSAAVLGPIPHYAARLSEWAAVFGTNHLRLFNYDDLMSQGQTMHAHFLERVVRLENGAALAATDPGFTVNSSFSHPAAYVLNRMNAAYPLFVDGLPNPAFQFNRQRFLAALEGPAFSAPAELFEPLQHAHRFDVEGLRSLGGESMSALRPPDPNDFGGDAAQTFSGDATLDSVSDVLTQTCAEAIRSNAREKFFAAMTGLSDPARRDAALRQIEVARFLMADQSYLISSGNWLFSAGEADMARRYLAKAQRFDQRPAALKNLERRFTGD